MTPTPITPRLSLLLIADSDSQLLACEALCTAPTTLNVHWTINVIPRDGTPQALLQRLGCSIPWNHVDGPLHASFGRSAAEGLAGQQLAVTVGD